MVLMWIGERPMASRIHVVLLRLWEMEKVGKRREMFYLTSKSAFEALVE
jgi:hypothetical protein